jgi:hypothetical protein
MPGGGLKMPPMCVVSCTVVPTTGRRPAWRDLASTNCRQIVAARSLPSTALRAGGSARDTEMGVADSRNLDLGPRASVGNAEMRKPDSPPGSGRRERWRRGFSETRQPDSPRPVDGAGLSDPPIIRKSTFRPSAKTPPMTMESHPCYFPVILAMATLVAPLSEMRKCGNAKIRLSAGLGATEDVANSRKPDSPPCAATARPASEGWRRVRCHARDDTDRRLAFYPQRV